MSKLKVPDFHAEAAARAADFIASKLNKKSWIQGTENAPNDRHCSLGWIKRVDQGFEETLIEELSDLCEVDGDIETWNDDEERTLAQVKAAFKKVAANLRKKSKAS